jgi:hypothetical protein
MLISISFIRWYSKANSATPNPKKKRMAALGSYSAGPLVFLAMPAILIADLIELSQTAQGCPKGLPAVAMASFLGLSTMVSIHWAMCAWITRFCAAMDRAGSLAFLGLLLFLPAALQLLALGKLLFH